MSNLKFCFKSFRIGVMGFCIDSVLLHYNNMLLGVSNILIKHMYFSHVFFMPQSILHWEFHVYLCVCVYVRQRMGGIGRLIF